MTNDPPTPPDAKLDTYAQGVGVWRKAYAEAHPDAVYDSDRGYWVERDEVFRARVKAAFETKGNP